MRLVFIDETGVKTNMTRLYGRAAKGMRANDSAPHGHWSVRTLISSVRADGETACLSVDAATDAEIFQAYVQNLRVLSSRLVHGPCGQPFREQRSAKRDLHETVARIDHEKRASQLRTWRGRNWCVCQYGDMGSDV